MKNALSENPALSGSSIAGPPVTCCNVFTMLERDNKAGFKGKVDTRHEKDLQNKHHSVTISDSQTGSQSNLR